MRKTLTLVGIYAILLINIALGLWMFLRAHELIMTVTQLLKANDAFGAMASARVEEAVNGITVVIMACLAVIIVPLLEHHYGKNHDSRVLTLKIIRVFAVQFLFIGIVQTATQFILSVALIGTGINLQTVVLLALGIFLTALRWWMQRHQPARSYPQQVPNHA